MNFAKFRTEFDGFRFFGLDSLVSRLGQIWDKIRTKVGKIWDKIRTKVGKIWDNISDKVNFERGKRALSEIMFELCPKFCRGLPRFCPKCCPKFCRGLPKILVIREATAKL